MPHFTKLAFACAFSIFGLAAIAQDTVGALSDPEIAHIVGTALKEEIATADLASKTTTDPTIRVFAQATSRAASRAHRTVDDMLTTRDLQATDDPLSQSLSGAAADQRGQLTRLTDAAFDKAYANNEMLYDQMVIGILDVTLSPSAKGGRLKAALETCRAFFKLQLAGTEALARRLK
ncbi:DUF4142 domain-containing protein [Methylocystis parvus]|uniref:DUF4142 domain-containing protein n=1 Tax=Methylocystis parvus TaxID=134 RepID=UPI003C7252C1